MGRYETKLMAELDRDDVISEIMDLLAPTGGQFQEFDAR